MWLLMPYFHSWTIPLCIDRSIFLLGLGGVMLLRESNLIFWKHLLQRASTFQYRPYIPFNVICVEGRLQRSQKLESGIIATRTNLRNTSCRVSSGKRLIGDEPSTVVSKAGSCASKYQAFAIRLDRTEFCGQLAFDH
jgi:hypothetical protein